MGNPWKSTIEIYVFFAHKETQWEVEIPYQNLCFFTHNKKHNGKWKSPIKIIVFFAHKKQFEMEFPYQNLCVLLFCA